VHRIQLPVLALAAALFLLGGHVADAAPADPRVHHDLAAQIDPAAHRIEVTDTITFPDGLKSLPRRKDGGLVLQLHAALEVTVLDGSSFDIRALPADAKPTMPPRRSYALVPRDGGDVAKPVVKLRYAGVIDHSVKQVSAEYARSFSQTPGTIEDKGVFLGGSSWWVPRFGDELVTFRLAVTLPEGWAAVSQGVRPAAKDGTPLASTWVCEHPMDEIYLIANRFTEYGRGTGSVEAQVFLRSKDDNLAAKYLEVTAQYIEMYRKLLGPYPYKKFALIENFWETGYGMPSFTLLGPRVIRFPFILHSSYPHEILHNWWGNSVYVDWGSGNWCEGLTAYLADHLVKEGQGRGHEYRMDQLKGYRNYVNAGRDFPLTEFRSRHSAATQAVGYGKCLMTFHMLRRRIGDKAFVTGLQRFYRTNRFKRASWADVRTAFEDATESDLKAWFAQWVERTGAPILEAALVVEDKRPGGPEITLALTQAQEGPAYDLDVPVQLTFVDRPTPELRVVRMTKKTQLYPLDDVIDEVARVDVDPAFDLFRRLDRAEIPSTLGEVFGAPKTLLLVPAAGDDPLAEAWAAFAKGWAKRGDVEIAVSDPSKPLPTDRSVWVLGSGNSARRAFAETLARADAGLREDVIDFGRTELPRAAHSFAFTARHPANAELAIGWIGASHAAALPGLARKLPHYGKYSYLGFQGDEPTNVAKGRWDAAGSPLARVVAESTLARATLPTRMPLARLAPVFDPARLQAHVDWLADDAREGRGVGTQGLADSAVYIAKAFRTAGLEPGAAGGGWFQSFEVAGGPDGQPAKLKNVVAVLKGSDPKLAAHPVVLGAHYDHLGKGWPDARKGHEGKIHNGADDNASGVAVLLELAQLLASTHKPKRSIVFVAFSGEEWGRKGSMHYAASVKAEATKPFAMINIDSVGRLGEKKLTILGSGSATEWRHIAMGVGFTTGVESECVAEGPAGSDQVSFHEIGVPAVQVFSGLHGDYHRSTDTAEKVDIDGLVKAATFVRESAVYLSERERPMTSTLGAGKAKPAVATKGRRVSLGTMPDFAYTGEGVRIGGVTPGSPAATAGLAKGDILLSIDGTELVDLRGFTDVLRAKAPGDVITIRFKRGDELREAKATLKAR